MAALPLAIATALVALRCQLLSDDPYILGSVSRVLPSTRPGFIKALNETRRLIGCPPIGDIDEPSPLFFGGQCPGVLYNVFARGFPAFGPELTQSSGGVLGPIESILRTPTGNPDAVTIGLRANGQNLTTGFGITTSEANAPTWRIINVVRVDGQADNCGNVPPIYPPPTNFNFDTDVTYEIDDGTEVTVNIPFVFAPITANFDGTLRIPVDFSLGGFEFSGDINLPDFDLTINPPRLPPGSGDDLTGQGEDEEGETTPPKPPGDKIIGVVITASSISPQIISSIEGEGITPIYIPRLGSVKFVYSIGTATFFSSDIDIKDRRTFIECPFSQGADAVVTSPAVGVTINATPIRGFPLATIKDLRPPA